MNMEKTIGKIREHHRRRDDFLRAEGNLTRQIKSIQRRLICYTYDLSPLVKKESSQICQIADHLNRLLRNRKLTAPENAQDQEAQERAQELELMALFNVEPLIVAESQVHKPLMQAEKELIELVGDLPALEWWGPLKGARALGLGQIVGEAGDLSNYPTKMALWKRMGLAVIEGNRQRKNKDKELALLHGYNPKRRSVMFGLGDAMIRVKGGTGTYAPVYYHEKARQMVLHPDLLAKKGGKGHMHNRARRYMEKMMLRDLWQVWTGRKPVDYMPQGDAWPELLKTG